MIESATNTTGLIVPELDQNLEILPFDNSEFIVQHRLLNYQVNINKETHRLIGLIDGKRNINDITDLYRENYALDLSQDFVHQLIYGNLARYGIVKQDEFVVEKRQRTSYLRLSFIILRKQWVGFITPYLSFLFNRPLFYSLLLSMAVFIGVMIWGNYAVIAENAEHLFSLNIVLYIVAFQLGGIIHEFGHAAACRRFGARHGGIGFGFYLLIPVLFADVSDAWRLKRTERIMVNLGGIYFEMILASALLVAFLFNGHIAFLVIPCLLVLNTLYNLNPLVKYDGYWVLSDATKTPNLHRNAFKKLGQFWLNLRGTETAVFTRKDYFLILYGFISLSYIFIFLFTIVLINPQSVLMLPVNLVHYLEQSNSFRIAELGQFVFPAIFWLLVAKLVLAQFRRRLQKKPAKAAFTPQPNS